MSISTIINNDYIICSCEGTAEECIMNLLLDNNCLIFSRENLIDSKVTRIRPSKKIEEHFLMRAYEKKIHIIRIIDSRNENFKFSKQYRNRPQVINENPINIYTHPEIEILIILAEGEHENFDRSQTRTLSRRLFPKKNIKSREFILDYFSDNNKLLRAIKKYKEITVFKSGDLCLYDLLKEEIKDNLNNQN